MVPLLPSLLSPDFWPAPGVPSGFRLSPRFENSPPSPTASTRLTYWLTRSAFLPLCVNTYTLWDSGYRRSSSPSGPVSWYCTPFWSRCRYSGSRKSMISVRQSCSYFSLGRQHCLPFFSFSTLSCLYAFLIPLISALQPACIILPCSWKLASIPARWLLSLDLLLIIQPC